ncbi:MAG TPA: hypothetical protein VM911_15870 [Pyrinomonadaceae bacterium]|nr:hypothetical protein [Pyrinomonadaceae bacterium]
MRRYHEWFTIRRIAFLTAAAALLLIVPCEASAQQPPRPSTSRSSGGRMGSGTQIGMEQEMQVRGDVRDRAPETEDKLRQILQELKEDFERIQAINENLLAMLKTNEGFSYARITDLTTELRKRARRFRDNAVFPPPGPAAKDEKKLDEINQDQEMKDALLVLNERVNKFIDNPLFQSPEWSDTELKAKASRDLETVIEMSAQIKKSAEKLGKSIQ